MTEMADSKLDPQLLEAFWHFVSAPSFLPDTPAPKSED